MRWLTRLAAILFVPLGLGTLISHVVPLSHVIQKSGNGTDIETEFSLRQGTLSWNRTEFATATVSSPRHWKRFDKWTIDVAYWLRWTAVILAILVLDRLAGGPAHRRLRRMKCAECGYDMRMTPTRCPECGTKRETATS